MRMVCLTGFPAAIESVVPLDQYGRERGYSHFRAPPVRGGCHCLTDLKNVFRQHRSRHGASHRLRLPHGKATSRLPLAVSKRGAFWRVVRSIFTRAASNPSSPVGDVPAAVDVPIRHNGFDRTHPSPFPRRDFVRVERGWPVCVRIAQLRMARGNQLFHVERRIQIQQQFICGKVMRRLLSMDVSLYLYDV